MLWEVVASRASLQGRCYLPVVFDRGLGRVKIGDEITQVPGAALVDILVLDLAKGGCARNLAWAIL